MTKQIRDALTQLNHQNLHKLVLDLRDCALGDEQEGISTAQLFLSSGTITTLKGQTVSPVVYRADPEKVVWTQPVTVLIGNGTAGPAEIMASAIADNHRGETVGDRTFGTASMQKLIQLDDGAALILTVANFYTPAGKEIPAEGVAPKTEVRTTYDDLVEESNPNETPLAGQAPSTDDPVIKAAIQILEGADAAQKSA